MDIFDVIEEWDLNTDNINFHKYSRSNIRDLAQQINNLYSNKSEFSFDRYHLGLNESIRFMENKDDKTSINNNLIFSEQMWLPDPLYSMFSDNASKVWMKLPDSGSDYITEKTGIHIQWKSYWTTPIKDRIEYLNETFPIVLRKINNIKLLCKSKIVYLKPWELIFSDELLNIKKILPPLLENTDILKQITEKYVQSQYNLGPRLGAMGVTLSQDDPIHNLKKGTDLWMVDKSNIIVYGILNTILTDKLGSNFILKLPGDKIVYEFIRSGGYINLEDHYFNSKIYIPNLDNLSFNDIISIREDSETLEILRKTLTKAKEMNNSSSIEVIKMELQEISRKMKEDRNFLKINKINFRELAIGGFIGFASGAISGGTLPITAATTSLGAGTPFIVNLINNSFGEESKRSKKRIDLLLKITDKIK